MDRNWTPIKDYTDIRFDLFEGIGRIMIDRPEVYNAFRPETNKEMIDAMDLAREDQRIGVVVITGAGDKAFCSGGDQNVKGRGGYIGADGVPRLNVLDLHKRIREIPKPVVAMVNGYAIGGGHVLHVVCDLTIAADHARFGQTGPKVGSFDAGFGSSYLARHVGQKRAREIWFLCQQYSAQEAFDMGMVNKVVPLAQLEDTTVEWCRIMLQRSPFALRMIKRGLNAELDGQRGLMEFAGDATLMYYLMDEAQEGRNAFIEKRDPDFSKYPKFPMMMLSRRLALMLPLLQLSTVSMAQFNQGDFMVSLGGSWKSEEYRVKESIDSELDLMIGYHPIKRMGVGLMANWGLTEFSYAETDSYTGATDYNYKDGRWGGIGPYIRGHLGAPEFSVFGQLSALFGKLEQDSENNLTNGNPLYYRQEGNFQQYSLGAGVWWYFTRRIGVEVLGTADWTAANIRSGNVGSDGEVDQFNSEHYDATGGGWSLKLLYWFRLDKGARKPADPGS